MNAKFTHFEVEVYQLGVHTLPLVIGEPLPGTSKMGGARSF